MFKRANTELLASITGFIVFGVFWMARNEEWRRPSAVWPEAILQGMFIVSVILLVLAFVRPTRDAVFQEGSKTRMALAAGGLAVWAVAVAYVGFFVGSVVMFVALAIVVSRGEQLVGAGEAPRVSGRKIWLWGAIILCEIGVLYLVFSELLEVPLPTGIAF